MAEERPKPDFNLGTASAECFIYSAAHDSDEEFLRSYGLRLGSMYNLHGANPDAAEAFARLDALLSP